MSLYTSFCLIVLQFTNWSLSATLWMHYLVHCLWNILVSLNERSSWHKHMITTWAVQQTPRIPEAAELEEGLFSVPLTLLTIPLLLKFRDCCWFPTYQRCRMKLGVEKRKNLTIRPRLFLSSNPFPSGIKMFFPQRHTDTPKNHNLFTYIPHLFNYYIKYIIYF